MVYLDEERSGHFNEQQLTLTFGSFEGIDISLNLDNTQAQSLLGFLKEVIDQ